MALDNVENAKSPLESVRISAAIEPAASSKRKSISATAAPVGSNTLPQNIPGIFTGFSSIHVFALTPVAASAIVNAK
ncbi:MAG: hypothetical protein WBY66_25325, partial [Candidatus Acidiferrales bacterium]